MMILITLIMIITPIAGKGKKKKNREWIVSKIDKVCLRKCGKEIMRINVFCAL